MNLVSPAGHVVVERDVWDWLMIWVTLAALIISVAAIWIARGARHDVDRDLRQTFELGVLKDLRAMWMDQNTSLHPRMIGLLVLLPDDTLPALHEYLHGLELPPLDTTGKTASEQQQDLAAASDARIKALRAQIPDEFDRAVNVRVGRK